MRITLGLAALGVVGMAALLSTGGAQTAGVTVPASVVGYSTITVNGAVLSSLAHILSGDRTTITGSDLYLFGKLKKATVTEQFATGPTVTCPYVAKSGATKHFHCVGLSQSATRSSRLTVDVTGDKTDDDS